MMNIFIITVPIPATCYISKKEISFEKLALLHVAQDSQSVSENLDLLK